MNDSASIRRGQVRIPHSHQGLGRDGLAGSEVDDGLITHPQPVLVDGSAQHPLGPQPIDGPGAQVLVEDLGPIAASILGPVEGEIRLLQQTLGAVPGVASDGDPHAGRANELLVADHERGPPGLDDPLAQQHRFLGPRQILDDDGELVAAPSGQGVLRPQEGTQALGHLHQHGVADQVPDGIVDQLEPIEIEKEHCHEGVPAIEATQRVPQPIHEHRAIGDTGQWIGRSLVLEVEFGLPAITDVADGRYDQLVRSPLSTSLDSDFGPAIGPAGASETGHAGHGSVRVLQSCQAGSLDQTDVVGMHERILVASDELGRLPAEQGKDSPAIRYR